jgi:hypothetical protein
MTETTLWCQIEGKLTFFGVSISLNATIDNLKTEIYNKTPNAFVGYDPSDLSLTKVCYIMISM